MKHNRVIAAAAISASVIGGAAGGALLFTPGSSGAAVTATAAAPASTGTASTDRPDRAGIRQDVLATAATALGISDDDLKAELEAGRSIADVAEARGVDVDTVIDALVAEAQTGLKDRITAMVNGEAPLGGPGHGRGPGGAFEAGLDTVATTLGISEDDLRAELRDGKTLAEVAQAHGVSVDALVSKLVAAATEKVDQALADGKLTQDQATTVKSHLEERITDLVNGTRPEGRGPGGPGFRGFRGGPGGHELGGTDS